jgi:MFS family permease
MTSAAASPATRAIDLELAPHAALDPGAPLAAPLVRERTAAAPGKLFYGWVMVPLATLVMVCSAPGQTYGFMFFNPWLRRSLALSQTELSATYLLATLCAAAPLSYLGGLSDRVGLKRSLLAAVTAMAGACLLASAVRSTTMLFVACLGLRLVGAGLMSLLATNTLAAWFDRRLPLACGIMQFSMAASMALVPVGLMTLIDAVGWRGAYGCLGIALAAVMLPLVAVVYRERPSDLGQRRDGDAAMSSGDRSSARAAAPATAWRIVDDDHPPSLNLAAALRTRMFWMLLISTGVWSLIGTGLMFHLESLLRAHDLG